MALGSTCRMCKVTRGCARLKATTGFASVKRACRWLVASVRRPLLAGPSAAYLAMPSISQRSRRHGRPAYPASVKPVMRCAACEQLEPSSASSCWLPTHAGLPCIQRPGRTDMLNLAGNFAKEAKLKQGHIQIV